MSSDQIKGLILIASTIQKPERVKLCKAISVEVFKACNMMDVHGGFNYYPCELLSLISQCTCLTEE